MKQYCINISQTTHGRLQRESAEKVPNVQFTKGCIKMFMNFVWKFKGNLICSLKNLQASRSLQALPEFWCCSPLCTRAALAGPLSVSGRCATLARKCFAPERERNLNYLANSEADNNVSLKQKTRRTCTRGHDKERVWFDHRRKPAARTNIRGLKSWRRFYVRAKPVSLVKSCEI